MNSPKFLRVALALPALVLAGITLASCGGEDPGDGDAARDTPPASEASNGLEVTDGISPDDLLACLTDAALPAALDDATPLGVEVPTQGIEVKPLDGWDGTQGAELWVFADPSAAADNRTAITLADEDTPTSRLAGNVVVRYFAVPEPDDQQLTALDTCLPS